MRWVQRQRNSEERVLKKVIVKRNPLFGIQKPTTEFMPPPSSYPSVPPPSACARSTPRGPNACVGELNKMASGRALWACCVREMGTIWQGRLNKSPCIGFVERSPRLRCPPVSGSKLYLLKRERLNLNLIPHTLSSLAVCLLARGLVTGQGSSPALADRCACSRRGNPQSLVVGQHLARSGGWT